MWNVDPDDFFTDKVYAENFSQPQGYFSDGFHQGSVVFVGQVPNELDLAFWNHQSMTFNRRVDV